MASPSVPRVLVAGHLCIDFFPAIDQQPGLEEGALYAIGPMQTRLGGCVYTTGTTLAGFGIEVRLAAALGDDLLGSLLLHMVHAEGLDSSRFLPTESSTSYSIVTQAPGRDRTFWHHAGANERFDGRDLDLSDVDMLHVGYPNLLTRLCDDDGAPLVDLFRRAREAGCATSLDLAVVEVNDPGRVDRWTRFLQNVLPHTDVLTPSIDDLSSALGWQLRSDDTTLTMAADHLLNWGTGVVLVTAGADGLLVATADIDRLAQMGRLSGGLAGHAGVRHLEPAVPVTHVVGTTGAGDVATAAFLAGLLRGASPVASAELAAHAAAQHVSGLMPWAGSHWETTLDLDGHGRKGGTRTVEPGPDVGAIRPHAGVSSENGSVRNEKEG